MLERKLLEEKVSKVIIFLDEDARMDALKLEKHLSQYDMDVRLVLTQGKDASDMGFAQAWQEISEATTTNFKEFIEQRLSII
jgi:hypothetical protein